ncbi:DUF1684 domain-containing protein [Flavobacteriaceae bacterium TP-CH-4]|uniref:DUF1684 domain-containing protein n=1 Tax=Pelagihabitans pacificus TaxID=2696054 RepID=A0A967AUS6_9FLAO|nr:DUF1684 domain-containing protein [Pelagihabitans pacificus]NHF60771.1 DUF1684 domain-containing protein [Pelagihabitans pacificus]
MMAKKRVLLTTLFLVAFGLNARQDEQSAVDFQQELNRRYSGYGSSPLEDRGKIFTGHDFYPITNAFRIEAQFIKAFDPLPFKMETTGNSNGDNTYKNYGEAQFDVEGREYGLHRYRSPRSSKTEEYKNLLFHPITDLTTGKETYEVGRYIDLEIPIGDTIMIDLNKAYNPYCAYNKNYSCEIPPNENHLGIAVVAGVKEPKK